MNYYLGVRSLLAKIVKGDAPDTARMNDAVREMLDRAILSDEVIGLVSSTNEMDMETLEILSEEYLDRVSRIPGLNTRFKVLQRLTNKSLNALGRTNRIKSMEFTERFNRIVQKYNDRHFRAEDITNLVQELTDFALELKEEATPGDELGITIQEKAFYDVLDYIITKEDFEFDRSILPDMAREMRECTDRTCSVLDWKNREDVKARLKMDLARIMKKYGFPPVYYNGVYEKVFEQIENYKVHC